MSAPTTPTAEAVARLTAQMLDPWERVRCLPRCRSDEPMNHGECDCGSQQFVSDLRTLLAAYADAARDRERMDWLEGEYEREHIALIERRPLPRSLFRTNNVITRAAIDAARTGEAR